MTVAAQLKRILDERRALLPWIALGLSSGLAVNVAAWAWWPRLSPLETSGDRLLLAVQCCAGIGFVALLMMQSLWRIHETPRAEDPFANAESRRWKINQRTYTNTVEQTLIFVPLYLGLAVRMAPEDVYMLPAMMAIWCAGRILFWIGYHCGPYARAVGMDWTTVTTLITAAWFLATLI